MGRAIEALLLGFSSGLVCTASCGAVLLPFLVARARGLSGTAWLLGQFLGGRFVGYVAYATFVWGVAGLAPSDTRSRALAFGVAHVMLALMLGRYAATGRASRSECRDPDARLRRPRWLFRADWTGPALLGLWSGVSLCAPFVAATVRAAETPGLVPILTFFVLFFVGTAVWFLPFLGVAPLRRFQGAVPAARAAMGVVAVYYAYIGLVTLGGRWLHGS